PGLTVAENIALPLDGGRAFGRVDWRARRRNASQILRQVGAAIDPDREVGRLSMPERQLVEIAKAIGANARILIMDEPTASLTDREIGGLLEVVRRLRAAGAGVVGSGRTELAETLFGLTPPDEGDILVNGAAAAIASPAHAIRLGIGYVPEDRQRHGVIPAMSIAANTTLSNLAAVSSRGLIDRAAERRASA